MDKRVMRERMRRKRRQLLFRKIMRYVITVGLLIGAVALVVRFVVNPLIGKFSNNRASTVEVKAQAEPVDPEAAVRIPIKGAADVAKAASKTPGWQEDANGKWYQNPDGSYFAGGKQEIDGKTYYFDENGYIKSGWITIEDKDYLFKDDGTLDPAAKRKMVALTFDDGPGKYTDRLLDALEKNNAKATFFMLGQNVGSFPDAVKRMQELGCELGNHSYDHLALSTLDGAAITNEFEKTNNILKDLVGAPATVARTPYGDQDATSLSYVGMPCFMWNIDTLDWKTLNADSTYNEVMNNVGDGDIILMHDIHEPSVDAAERIIPALIEQGYKLVTVSELAKAKGVTLEDGVSYFDFTDSTVAALTGGQEPSGDSSGEFYDDYTGDNSSGDVEDAGNTVGDVQ